MTEQRSAWLLQGEEVKGPLHYPECGLDDVYLLNGYEHVETAYGHGIAVKGLEELREAIALRLVRRKKVLSGKEVRFLRKQLDLTQADLGKLLGMDSQTVARWEKGQNKVNGAADRVLRLLSVEHMTGRACKR